MRGEVIIYEIPAQTTDTGLMPPSIGIKVGDGVNFLQQLPWIQAKAGDVYAWAKEANKPSYTAAEIIATTFDTPAQQSTVQAVLSSLNNKINTLTGGGEGAQSIEGQIATAIEALDGVITGTPDASKTLTVFTQSDGVVTATFGDIAITESQVTDLTTHLGQKAPTANPTFTGTVTLPAITSSSADTSAATKKYVDDAVSNATQGLSGAMHFKGKSTVDLSADGNSTANPTIAGYDWNEKTAGDVVLNSVGEKEYVWDGTKWIELGDEASFAVKGSITNTDIATNANIDQSKIANLTSDLASKQDALGFTTGTAYNKNTNPVATQSYVDNKASASDTTYSFAAGDNDGEIKITPTQGGNAGTPITVKPKNLHQIATSGSIYDIEEGSNTTTTNSVQYLILDCGSASVLID